MTGKSDCASARSLSIVIDIFEDDAAAVGVLPPPIFARFAGGADVPLLPPPPPFVKVSVPKTVHSGASSHALANRLGRRIIHKSDDDACIAP